MADGQNSENGLNERFFKDSQNGKIPSLTPPGNCYNLSHDTCNSNLAGK